MVIPVFTRARFMAKVAIEAIKGAKIAGETAGKYRVRLTQIAQEKK